MKDFATYGTQPTNPGINHAEPYWKKILRSYNIRGREDVKLLKISEDEAPLRATIKNYKAVYRNHREEPYLEVTKTGLNCGCGHGRGIEEIYFRELDADIGDYETAALEALAYTLGRRELEGGIRIVDNDLEQNGSGFSGSAKIYNYRGQKKYTLEIDPRDSPRINLLGGVEYPWYLGLKLNEITFTEAAENAPHAREFSSTTPNTGVKLYHIVPEGDSHSFEKIAGDHADFLQTKKEYKQKFPFSSVFLENTTGINLAGDYFYGPDGSIILFSDEIENKKDAGRVRSLKKLELSKITS